MFVNFDSEFVASYLNSNVGGGGRETRTRADFRERSSSDGGSDQRPSSSKFRLVSDTVLEIGVGSTPLHAFISICAMYSSAD